jgi:Tfp pilus assembly protein PilO
MKKPASKLKRKIKNSNLIVILPMIGVGVAFLLLVFLPKFREMHRQRDLIKMQQDYIAQTASLEGEISVFEARVKQTEKYCQDWESKAPLDADIPQIHSQINQCVSQAGATVTGFDPQPPIPLNTLNRVPLIVRAAGTFTQMHGLLAKLEAMPETMWLENIRLKAAGKDTDRMDCEVTLVVFAKKSKKSD